MVNSYYIQVIQYAVDFIEENLLYPIVIQEISKKSGMSQWYFQRVFKAVTGDTVKEYVRKRRLTYAAGELKAKRKVNILQLALDCQFESQESFTRAFKKYFGTTPKRFISSSKSILSAKLRIDENYLNHLFKGVNMKPEVKEQSEKYLVGIGVQFVGVFAEGGKQEVAVSKLWGRFKSRVNEIKNRIGNEYIGVVDCYPTDEENESDENLVYFACVEVDSFTDIPDGMRPVVIPKSEFAEFKHEGAPNDIDQTLRYIYGSWLPKSGFKRANGPDLEVLGADMKQKSELTYLIPVKSE
jgi:AraC family transcriptional regulator